MYFLLMGKIVQFFPYPAVVLKADVEETVSSLLSPDQMAGYAVTAVFTIIGLMVTFFILKKFLFKPVIKLINQRKDSVTNELEEAAEKTVKANDILKEADKQILHAKEEASSLISEARVQADKQAQSVVEQAQKEANDIRKKANAEAQHTHDAMLEQMREEIADLAVTIATKVVGSAIDENRQRELSDKFLEETMVNRGEKS